MSAFTLEGVDGSARAGTLHTAHGDVATPAFMPVGTQAAVKALTAKDVAAAGAQMILANAYHCYLRPGADVIAAGGGLHGFMSWPRAILTDSGGFQIFSLANLATVDDAGYHFASHLDGSRHTFTPESVVALQEALGSDVAMVLDDCAPAGVEQARAKASAERTVRWAERAKAKRTREDQLTFGIVQGSTFEALRRWCARELVALDFPGYAIGGLWVGEPKTDAFAMARSSCEDLPSEKPRYLMGVGTPEDLLACIEFGVDMFDCVYPTRSARHALALTSVGRLNLRNARFRDDVSPLDPRCACEACAAYTRAYVSHLFRAGETLGPRLVSLHNLTMLSQLAADARRAILDRRYVAWRDERLERMRGEPKE